MYICYTTTSGYLILLGSVLWTRLDLNSLFPPSTLWLLKLAKSRQNANAKLQLVKWLDKILGLFTNYDSRIQCCVMMTSSSTYRTSPSISTRTQANMIFDK